MASLTINASKEESPLVTKETEGEGEDPYTYNVPHGRRGHQFYASLAGWWCANTIVLAALTSVVWPAQIEAIVNDPSKQDLYNGFIPAFGALVSLIVTPIAGSLSDHSTSRIGRRKLYIITGSIISVIFFVFCPLFDASSGFLTIWILCVLIMGIQFGQQWAGGPYAGLMPDLVPKRYYGLASGWLGLAIAIGNLIGALGAGFLTDATNFWPVYIFTIGAFILFALPTVIFIKEIPRPPPTTPFSMKKLMKEFYLDPKDYRDFYWVILTRFFMDMGVYSILPFFQYFYQDIIKSQKAVLFSSITVAVIVVFSIPATISAGYVSDRIGRKILVYISTALMALGVSALCVVAYYPSIPLTLILAGVVGIGYGAYQAVDWALAWDVLPPNANVAKDMGIWHLSFVLPQVIAPVVTGAILTAIKRESFQLAYASVFGITAIWFILATVFVYPVRSRKHKKEYM